MSKNIVPMIHVPDVRATANWYTSIGFKVAGTHDDDGDMKWALLEFGDGQIMLNTGGRPSAEHRREVDLYVRVANVDEVFRRIGDRVELVEGPHDAFYGAREFIIRDLNGFWVTFGQPRPRG